MRVKCTEEEVEIQVQDTGIGIKEDFLPQIYEPFRQEYMGDDRPYEGVGLGLTITKRLIKLMNGEIHVASTHGQGSCFRVRFPRLKETIDSSRKRRPADENVLKLVNSPDFVIPRSRMLVVEDNFETQLLIKRLLKPHLDVVLLDTFDAALLAFSNNHFDMVLLDINLGEKRTGTDLLHKLRAMPGKEPFYAVAFTAYALPTDRSHFLTQGFDDYLPKPFTRPDLMEVMQRACLLQTPEV